MSTQEYILDVPATMTTIWKLMEELIDNHSTETFHTERVVLYFGKCRLLCQDEREREEFRDKVTVAEAFWTLRSVLDDMDKRGW